MFHNFFILNCQKENIERKVIGIQNQSGNFCYIATALQNVCNLIYYLPEKQKLENDLNNSKNENMKIFLKIYNYLIKNQFDENCDINLIMKKFVQTVWESQNPQKFDLSIQNDADEMISYIIDFLFYQSELKSNFEVKKSFASTETLMRYNKDNLVSHEFLGDKNSFNFIVQIKLQSQINNFNNLINTENQDFVLDNIINYTDIITDWKDENGQIVCLTEQRDFEIKDSFMLNFQQDNLQQRNVCKLLIDNSLSNKDFIYKNEKYKIISACIRQGNSNEQGHWYCVVRNKNQFYQINDSQVSLFTNYQANIRNFILVKNVGQFSQCEIQQNEIPVLPKNNNDIYFIILFIFAIAIAIFSTYKIFHKKKDIEIDFE